MRALTETEQLSLKTLTSYSVNFTLIQPTITGLKKSIMDATKAVRSYLREQNIHDYNFQQAGPNHKIIYDDTFFISDTNLIHSKTSMYRPLAKQKGGDPRIWFSGLNKYASPDDILAITYLKNTLFIINITKLPIKQLLDSAIISPLKELAQEFFLLNNNIADELLYKLRNIAQTGPLPAIKHGDTAVGHTLETALGIAPNSSRKPDYKGIELKSYRTKKRASQESRKNLFAQVPNWKLSLFKSSREILDNFGYWRNDEFKLYCTVSSQGRNSQGLMLKLDETYQLIENSSKENIGDFAIWLIDDLKKRLLEKHNETFWIGADSISIEGNEYFQYKKVLHTRKPVLSTFDLLIEQGQITLDHLIKRDSNGNVKEKGPLFKINGSAIEMLFPEPKEYMLV